MLFGRTQKNPIKIADKGVVEWKYAACGYCSTGCYIEVGLNADAKPVASRGVAEADVNRGKLCLKGIFEHALVGLVFAALTPALGSMLTSVTALGLALEGVGLVFHARDLQARGDEGAASYYEQITRYGYPYWLRNGLLVSGLLCALGIVVANGTDPAAFGLLTLFALGTAVLGRALFYVLVIPTTMPGAFFWRNRGFVEHAREVGLADMPQLGVAYQQHHPFKPGELLETLRATSLREAFAQARRILTE